MGGVVDGRWVSGLVDEWMIRWWKGLLLGDKYY